MRTATTLALAAALGLSLTGVASAESRNFDLRGFDRLDINTGIDATVTIGETFAITANSGSSDALDNLRLDVSGGTLRASIDQNFIDFIISGGLVGMLFSNGNAVAIDITMPAITGIAASSGADVRATDTVSPSLVLDASSGASIAITNAVLGNVDIDVSSGADIEISGTCESIDAQASSGSAIEAEDLLCEIASAGSSSGADISLHATKSFAGDASSGSDVEVYGKPAHTEHESSSGGRISFED